jgi:hypothetical protein
MYTRVRRMLLGCALVSGIVLGSHSGAFAVDGYDDFLPAWTQVASACATDEDSLSKASTAGAYFTFKGDSVSDPGGGCSAPSPCLRGVTSSTQWMKRRILTGMR